MDKFEFQIQGNKIAFKATGYTDFAILAKKDGQEVSEEYLVNSMPDAEVCVNIASLPWKSDPKPGEEYDILVCGQNPQTKDFTNWGVQKWTAPKKTKSAPRVKNPSIPVATPPTPNAAPSPATNPDPNPAPMPVNPPVPSHQSIVRDISERLGKIETDLGEILETFRLKAVPPNKYLLKVEKTLEDVLMEMREISEQIEKGKDTHPEYVPISEKSKTCREMAIQASKLWRKAQDALLARSMQVPRAPAATATRHPAPIVPVAPAATTPVVDLDPINDRIDNLEQQLRDTNDQLADKANSDDLHKLSRRVSGLTDEVTDLNTQVGDLKTTCTDGFASLQGAIAGITTTQIANTAAATSVAASATPPAANATPAAATAPVVPTANATHATPAATSTTTSGGKRFSPKNAFLVFVFGLATMVITGIIFSAPRPQQTTPIIVVPTSQPNTPPTTPVIPPPATLPKMSEEELNKKRAEIRAQQELVFGAHPSLMVRHTNTKPEEGVVKINGNGNVVGKHVTINNNYQERKTDSNVDGNHHTPTTGVYPQHEAGPRLVYTPRIWNPTRTLGTVETENPFGENTGYTRDY